jgi:hypothetical protein
MGRFGDRAIGIGDDVITFISGSPHLPRGESEGDHPLDALIRFFLASS